MSIFPGYKQKFELNNDLDSLDFSGHNKVHFWGAAAIAYVVSFWSVPAYGMLLGLIIAFGIAYGTWILWEIGDGWKPWWNDKRYKHYNTDPGLRAYIIANGLLSDKFSYQDAFVWDLFGSGLGITVAFITQGILILIK